MVPTLFNLFNYVVRLLIKDNYLATNLSNMLATYSLEKTGRQLSENSDLESLKTESLQLNNTLREANHRGIGLYLTNPYNTYIQDYRNGGILFDEDAQKCSQTNFGKSDVEYEYCGRHKQHFDFGGWFL